MRLMMHGLRCSRLVQSPCRPPAPAPACTSLSLDNITKPAQHTFSQACCALLRTSTSDCNEVYMQQTAAYIHSRPLCIALKAGLPAIRNLIMGELACSCSSHLHLLVAGCRNPGPEHLTKNACATNKCKEGQQGKSTSKRQRNHDNTVLHVISKPLWVQGLQQAYQWHIMHKQQSHHPPSLRQQSWPSHMPLIAMCPVSVVLLREPAASGERWRSS